MLQFANILTDLSTGMLSGTGVVESRRTVADLSGYWEDEAAARQMGSVLLYTTQSWFPEPDGTEGAVLLGNTVLMPGQVGREFFMTRGHWHLKRSRGEMCITVSGQGAIVLMDDARNVRLETMTPGSSHWISGELAHRTVNTGDEPLVFLCMWPADCGHDYEVIRREGFAQRVLA